MALSLNDDKRVQSIDLIDLVNEKEVIKCNNIIIDTQMINFDDVTKENIKNAIEIGLKFLIIHTEY